jgi:hypothetical protein
MRWVVNSTPRPLYPREREPVAIVKEAGLAPGPFWTGTENLATTGIIEVNCKDKIRKGVDKIYLVQDTDNSPAFEDTVMYSFFVSAGHWKMDKFHI